MTYLGHQPLEEAREALLARHIRQNAEAALRVVKVAILDACLDHIKRSRDNKGSGSAGDRGDEVLQPCRLVVVLQLEQVLLGKGRSSKQLETEYQ